MLSKEEKKAKNLRLLSSTPVFKAVIALSLPTMLSQVIAVIYNMADTLFIGRLNDPSQVAAVTFALPLAIIFNAVANLFGVGGSAFISHCLGRKDYESARKGSCFAIYCGVGLALVYSLIVFLFRDLLYSALGASGATLEHMSNYVFYTVILGALPAVMNPLLAHLVRSEGASLQGSIGVGLGGVLNILLDPLFIFAFNMEVAGAGLATLLSNCAACIYLIVYIVVKRRSTTINAVPSNFRCGMSNAREIIVAGLPNCIISIMASSSNMVTNYLFSPYGDQIVAGWGIAKRI
ncbi:MAG: MATE family efflux transporter, partial [Bacilli bacterium]|nr:MATE family efflux transporter [Bacilli bacterium]